MKDDIRIFCNHIQLIDRASSFLPNTIPGTPSWSRCCFQSCHRIRPIQIQAHVRKSKPFRKQALPKYNWLDLFLKDLWGLGPSLASLWALCSIHSQALYQSYDMKTFQNFLLLTSFGPKYHQKNLKNSALELEKSSNHKIKALYNIFIH